MDTRECGWMGCGAERCADFCNPDRVADDAEVDRIADAAAVRWAETLAILAEAD